MTDALRVEVANLGIDVTLVCPGRVGDAEEGQAAKFGMPMEKAAKRIVQCARHPRREVILTPAGRGLVWLNAWAPWLVDRILSRARRREAPSHSGPGEMVKEGWK